jgi:signal transduction histidine kinase
MATLGIALYALFFINEMFSYLVPQDELYSKLLLFKDTLNRLIIGFIAFGLIGSYYMTKMIINPIQNMIDGSKELAKGNLSNRLETSKYEEINDLIETYNTMAESLQSLYTDLENKVLDRTKELEQANNELKNTQTMMVHSEKMRSLGQLVSGITHEINNPINFIHGNMIHLKNYSTALVNLIALYESIERDLNEDKQREIKDFKEKIELDFIKEDLPMLIKSCHEGTERTKNIIIDLKNFSRIDERVINNINLEKEIDTTLNILSNKIKGKIEVVKKYDDGIPLMEGFGGQLNQVFMNILDNACYAIKETGTINIRIKKAEKDVIIEFEDSGSGMNKEQTEKIFEPFYTTKPVGEGSGMGMSISYKVIQNHQGTITIESEVGKGTTFKIRLPIKMNVALNKEVETKV